MSYAEVTYEQVKNLKDQLTNALLIDVREEDEILATGFIPGSINIPLGSLEQQLKDISPEQFKSKYQKDKPNGQTDLVFTCRSGRRSQTAMDIATRLGYSKVKHFPGGWLEWEKRTPT